MTVCSFNTPIFNIKTGTLSNKIKYLKLSNKNM